MKRHTTLVNNYMSLFIAKQFTFLSYISFTIPSSFFENFVEFSRKIIILNIHKL
jgi:hypothetical protein